MNIEQIDENVRVSTSFHEESLHWYSAKDPFFTLNGFWRPYQSDGFVRMDPEVAASIHESLSELCHATAGGRIRFRTNSDYIAIRALMPQIARLSVMTLCGSAGFDLYVDNVFYRSFVPPYDMQNGYAAIEYLPGSGMKDILIHFPLYSSVSQLWIGLHKEAHVEKATAYRYEKPVVFYGSSITQGGCVTRPGNSYESIICRNMNIDCLNLGFAGSAKGERSMAEYIAQLPMCALVLDYDYNAPDCVHLATTHEAFFQTIRRSQPELPILILTRPNCEVDSWTIQRRQIIYQTYRRAVRAGDKNVHFLNGKRLFGTCWRDGCTVDGVHPNELGSHRMAQAIGRELKRIL